MWFHYSGYDFGYLLKILTDSTLPSEEADFFDYLRIYFPNIYDVKYLMKSCKNLKGGLQEVAEQLEVLLFLSCFVKYMLLLFVKVKSAKRIKYYQSCKCIENGPLLWCSVYRLWLQSGLEACHGITAHRTCDQKVLDSNPAAGKQLGGVPLIVWRFKTSSDI